MKKALYFTLFVALLVFSVVIRFYFVDFFTGSRVPFALILLMAILATLYSGFVLGMIFLVGSSIVYGYAFLSPNDLSQLSSSSAQLLFLFIIEGTLINGLVHYLNRSHKRDHELRERFQVILSSIGDAVIAADRKGIITYMNARAQKLTGWHYREGRGNPLSEVMEFDDPVAENTFKDSILKALLEGEVSSMPSSVTLVSRDKKRYSIEDSTAPLRDPKGNIIGIVLIFRDVSNHRQLDEQREVLLGSISHELKNYITSIQGYASLLDKKVRSTDHSQIKSYISKLNDKVETMKEMITSMLDLSKIKMGRLDMDIDTFNLRELVFKIIEDTELEDIKRVKTRDIPEVMLSGDRVKIGQVLTNLLTNAIKYSKDDISITGDVKETEIELAVKDFGEGIDKENLEKIFRPFYRGLEDKERKRISGSGLGLYISKEIVRQHGGEMRAESSPGEGSTFYFSLPHQSKRRSFEEKQSRQEKVVDKITEVLRFYEKK